jgi:phosphoglycolate phosphatase
MKAGNIIFDLDGTLWDSSAAVAESWSQTIRASCNPLLKNSIPDADRIKTVMGLTMDEIGSRLFPQLSETQRFDLLENCMREENNYLAGAGGVLLENEEQVLSRLREKHRLFIVSNCQSGYIEAFFEFTGFERYFSDYLCWGDTRASKDVTIKQLIDKNSCINSVYVGDTVMDMKAAADAGIPFVFAAYGLGRLEPSSKPDEIAGSFEDLLRIFEC